MITDLFSHKIHSSGDEWPDKLVELAFLFNEFDGQPFDRDQIETRLRQIGPETVYVAQGRSKFRDEYSAYPAYFGLYKMVLQDDVWHIAISDTTKKYLIKEDPDVEAFLRLQLALFQYPNGMGGAYYSNSSRFRLQENTKKRTLNFIRLGFHLSPLRLISAGLIADSNLRSVPINEAEITYEEIFALANSEKIFQYSSPSPEDVISVLANIRSGEILPPRNFERRFHLLNHLGFLKSEDGRIKAGGAAGSRSADLEAMWISSLANLHVQFNGFDNVGSGEDLEEGILSGDWSDYFDAVRTLPREVVSILEANSLDFGQPSPDLPVVEKEEAPEIYRFVERDIENTKISRTATKRASVDPELTRIRRQRRHLMHKILVNRMAVRLKAIGALPLENEHIDLYSEIPGDGAVIFEMKSGGPNLLSQIRKGLSQLYEYRYRYSEQLRDDLALCLVLPEKPVEIPWVEDYLCKDRGVTLCWVGDDGLVEAPDDCPNLFMELINS